MAIKYRIALWTSAKTRPNPHGMTAHPIRAKVSVNTGATK